MLVLCWVLGRVWGWWEYAFFMGMEKGLYRAYVRRWMWNKMYTYIIRDKNTFSLPSIGAVRLLQRAPHQHKLAVYQQTETCSLTSLSGDVGGKYESIFSALCSCSQRRKTWWEKICDLRRRMNSSTPQFSLSLSLFFLVQYVFSFRHCVSSDSVTKQSFSPSLSCELLSVS